MGCAGSKAAEDPARKESVGSPPVRKSEEALTALTKRDSTKLSDTEAAKLDMLLNKYKYARRTSLDDGTAAKLMAEYEQLSSSLEPKAKAEVLRKKSFVGAGVRMSKADLKVVLKEVDDELFQYLFNIFDPENMGHVNADQFMLTTALIIKGENNLEKQIAACFYMFDVEKQDRLDRAEFSAMIEATVGLKLRYLLETAEGSKMFEDQLKEEYSSENLKFYQTASKYKLAEESERLGMAKTMNKQFVKEDADEQVNLPNDIVLKIQKELKQHISEETPPPTDLFEDASKEIYTLMERDTFRRMKNNPKLVEKLVVEFFEAADKDNTGSVTFDQYREWVMANPTVLAFFKDISKAAAGMIEKADELKTPARKDKAPQPSI